MEALQWIISAGTSFFEAIQLSNDLSHLRGSLPKAHILINRAEWGRFKDKELELLLSRLKDTTCDVEDLLREFDDQELRQKMEDTGRNRAGQLVSSSYNLAKSFLSGSKTRLKEAQIKLDMVIDDIEGALDLLGLNVEPAQLGRPLMPETSSVIGVPQVYGRDEERDLVIERLGVTLGRDRERDQIMNLLGVPLSRGSTSARAAVASTSKASKRLKRETHICNSHVSVLPIVGIGGVGKTTLAQFIYNDTRVKTYFDMRVWVCVSDIFDKRRITKEIIESITGEEFKSSGSLDALHVELKDQLMRHKFLLVLDDVWPIATNKWEAFFAPFRTGLDGSMVLLTTRFPKVANLASAIKPIVLEGLPTDIFRVFFNKCAFGEQDTDSYTQLQDIGQSIADRLCGSPLAAKTLGRLLSMELTQEHWRTIQSSELWQLPHEENDILPALQLSYLYLPWELKRCFAICSMFPKDYSFGRDEIVAFWVAQCFVQSEGMRLEDMGCRYLDDLRSRFLFQADPKFPKQNRYVMHDLIHDMAQSVSVGECFLMQDISYMNLRRPPHITRHMSVEVDNEALGRMGGIQDLDKLHSLRFGMRCEVEVPWFKHLSVILFLSLKGCKLVKLPESICELRSLRCLDISGSSIQELPEKFCCLYNLQYFYANHLKTIHPDVIKLVNLRRLEFPLETALRLSKISGLGNLSSLQNLEKFTVGKDTGRKIGELKGMIQLSGNLHICSLVNVKSTEEAAEARLVDKQYLKQLILEWRQNSSARGSGHNAILEGLRPPSNIECLQITRFVDARFSPSWLRQENLPALRTLSISESESVKEMVAQGRTSADVALGASVGANSTQQASVNSSSFSAFLPFISLTPLYLCRCHGLTNLDQWLSPEYLPSIKSIHLISCCGLESLPVSEFGGFVCLQDLYIRSCSRLKFLGEMVLNGSLQRLYFHSCGKLDMSLGPGCLANLASLTLLDLCDCHNMESIVLNSTNTSNLMCLHLERCLALSSIGGSHAFSSIKNINITGCPHLTEIEQPLVKRELRRSELKELQDFYNQMYDL